MKTILKLAAAVVLLVMIGGAVTLQSAIKDARAEQQELSKTGADTGASRENKAPAQPTAESDEAQRLREANKDLPKLRNEVRQLRRRADEMAKLRADNERLRNAPKTGTKQFSQVFVRREALVDAGLATPEATLQTVVWAMTHGDVKRMKDCVPPEALAQIQAQDEEQWRKRVAETVNSISGYRILNKQEVSADNVILQIEMVRGEILGDTPVKFKRVGNEWKLTGGL